jgi:hypothetical protein
MKPINNNLPPHLGGANDKPAAESRETREQESRETREQVSADIAAPSPIAFTKRLAAGDITCEMDAWTEGAHWMSRLMLECAARACLRVGGDAEQVDAARSKAMEEGTELTDREVLLSLVALITMKSVEAQDHRKVVRDITGGAK